jgi:hypothetical protein
MRDVLVACLMCSLYGWGIIGPSSVDARETGPVFSLNGEVAAGGLVVHQVPYGTNGSQNDGTFQWVGDTDPAGPRPSVGAADVRAPATRRRPAHTGCPALTDRLVELPREVG